MGDLAKKIGKMKEQVEKEETARREFAKRWGFLADKNLNRFYKPDELNADLKKELKLQDLCPYTAYPTEGESFFVSPEMHKSLLGICRCGRPRTEGHLVRCVQKAKNDILDTRSDMATDSKVPLVPPTSNAAIGWQQRQQITPSYQRWELSAKYVSPVYDMPGHRVTAKPYTTIHIG